MTASRPTAASATDVSPGGMLISRRLGSTISPGRSTVSSRVRNACVRKSKPASNPRQTRVKPSLAACSPWRRARDSCTASTRASVRSTPNSHSRAAHAAHMQPAAH